MKIDVGNSTCPVSAARAALDWPHTTGSPPAPWSSSSVSYGEVVFTITGYLLVLDHGLTLTGFPLNTTGR